MMMYPFFSLFATTLFLSTMLALFANHWVLVWLALELNMISFLPMINTSNWNQEQEACLKYLLFQALGSSLLLLSTTSNMFYFLMPLALMTKLGAAPFHMWFPSVMKSISWFPSLLLMTWQKIAPMCLLFSLSWNSPMLPFFGMMGALVGGLGGMNQSHFRPLLAYSSVGHMGWMIASIMTSPSISYFYLLTYLMISFTVMASAAMTNTSALKSTSKKSSKSSFFFLSVMLLSLGGLPPLAGFIPKLMVLTSMHSSVIPLILIVGSLMNLYYYLNFLLTLFLSNIFNKSKKKKFHVFYFALVYISTSPLPFITLSLIFL